MSDTETRRPSYMTNERMMIREMARDFSKNEVLPVANALDGPDGLIPMDLRKKMADLGFFGITIGTEYGGLGLGAFEYCLVAEELSRAWMSVGSLIARGNGGFLTSCLSHEQKAVILPRVAAGEYLAAAALSEAATGSDLASIACRANRDGDEWVINGSKYWCTFADGADYILLFARTSAPKTKRWEGISAFIIDKPRGELPKNCAGSPIPKIGYFGWKTYELAFSDCRLPSAALLGAEGMAFKYMASGLETARAHTAARSIGLAQGALEDAMAYAKERRQFGVAIAEFQAIRFKIATMATEVQAARQLLHFVCSEIDSGRRCDTEASMVKYFASEMSERVTSEAMQILGGAGYTRHFAVERYWRDARLTKIFEGTSEIQQRIISDNLLGRSDLDAQLP